LLGGGAAAFAGAAALLVLTTSSGERASAAPAPLTVVSSHAPIRLIALDGFDPATYTSLHESMPNLNVVFGGGLVSLQPQDTTDPARAWTTIATGTPPDVHGVRSIETRRVAGLRGVIARDGRAARMIAAASDLVRLTQPSVVSSEQRHAKPIWEVAEGAGLRTAVVNWWATWPAPSNGGIVVSDRAVLRLERGGGLDAEIAPVSIYQSLLAQWPSIRARAHDEAAKRFPDDGDPQTAAILRRSAELDASIAGIGESVSSLPVDLCMIYFPGLDIAQNALLGPSTGALSTSTMAARVDALRSYYPFLDGVLGPIIEPVGGRALMVVTQPGRVQSSSGGVFVIAPMRRDPANRPNSVASRPESSSAYRLVAQGSVLDVAPTLLAALGLPLSRELRGTPQPDLLSQWPPHGDRYVDTYGRPFVEPAPRTGKPLDQEMIDRLRSLGYVK
ncbi:MAG TPA: alkaline phosphatase family protein, partial [Vicinamibacterales bacterium]